MESWTKREVPYPFREADICRLCPLHTGPLPAHGGGRRKEEEPPGFSAGRPRGRSGRHEAEGGQELGLQGSDGEARTAGQGRGPGVTAVGVSTRGCVRGCV